MISHYMFNFHLVCFYSEPQCLCIILYNIYEVHLKCEHGLEADYKWLAKFTLEIGQYNIKYFFCLLNAILRICVTSFLCTYINL